MSSRAIVEFEHRHASHDLFSWSRSYGIWTVICTFSTLVWFRDARAHVSETIVGSIAVGEGGKFERQFALQHVRQYSHIQFLFIFVFCNSKSDAAVCRDGSCRANIDRVCPPPAVSFDPRRHHIITSPTVAPGSEPDTTADDETRVGRAGSACRRTRGAGHFVVVWRRSGSSDHQRVGAWSVPEDVRVARIVFRLRWSCPAVAAAAAALSLRVLWAGSEAAVALSTPVHAPSLAVADRRARGHVPSAVRGAPSAVRTGADHAGSVNGGSDVEPGRRSRCCRQHDGCPPGWAAHDTRVHDGQRTCRRRSDSDRLRLRSPSARVGTTLVSVVPGGRCNQRKCFPICAVVVLRCRVPPRIVVVVAIRDAALRHQPSASGSSAAPGWAPRDADGSAAARPGTTARVSSDPLLAALCPHRRADPPSSGSHRTKAVRVPDVRTVVQSLRPSDHPRSNAHGRAAIRLRVVWAPVCTKRRTKATLEGPWAETATCGGSCRKTTISLPPASTSSAVNNRPAGTDACPVANQHTNQHISCFVVDGRHRSNKSALTSASVDI